MSGRLAASLAASLAALTLAACGAAGPSPLAPSPSRPSPGPSPPRQARFFHASPEESFWVSRSPQLDRVIAGGARLELAPTGEVTAAAWDADLSARGEPLLGALAVPARLGGGFVCWTRARVFRARDFAGPLEPVALGIAGEVAVRGARAGLSSVVVFTDAGPRELLAGSARLVPARDPALLDTAAISASRAARLDVFGRLLVTGDGGAAWSDLSPSLGLGARQLIVGDGELWVDAWQGRFLVGPGGKLEPGDSSGRGSYDSARAFQLVWKGPRVAEREDWPWGLRESSPLAIAVTAGAPVGDGTALGVVQGGVTRVDLATGKLVSLATDWIPGGLSCQPLRAADGVLFACVWERSQGYGGYVLRSVNGAPPEIDKAFSDDGSFVADDDGALGYVGSCRVEARYIDPEDQGRMGNGAGEGPIRPILCVRRGPGDWVERRVDVGDGATLVAWVPGRDGTAAALALAGDPLPPPAGTRRVVEQAGVRLYRLYPEIAGWSFKRPSSQPERAGLSGYVDRRFQIRGDGSIDGWLAPSSDGSEPVVIGVTLDPAGVPAVHEIAPGMIETVSGGAFAVALARDGELHESTDHGRTWRAAGRSPAPPGSSSGLGCSALGCALGPVVRLGWGDGAPAPRVSTEPFAPAEPAPLVRLACTPRGAPLPLAALLPAPPGARHTVSTGWGDTLEIVRDAGAPEPPSPPGSPSAAVPPPPAPPTPAAGASARAPKKPPPASPAVLRTHTLLVRPPFSPFAAPRRLNATDATFNPQRRAMVVPLLAPSGDVDLLVGGEHTELLVAGDRITVMPAFEGRRYVYGDGLGFTGLVLPGGRALVLGETRRRLALEDHGPGPPPPPLFLGLDRDHSRRRPVAIARRDDGALGVLVLDGGAPETVGLAPIDRVAASASPAVRLAPWSTVVTADDPRCKKGADPQAYRALVMIDPSAWLTLDAAALPGVALAHQGMALVRWGKDRVCLEALDVATVEEHRRGESTRSWRLVVRWGSERDRGGALRTGDLRQEVVCKVEAEAHR